MRDPKGLAFVAFAGTALGMPASASAHVWITSHESRYGMNEIKRGPCGRAGGGPGSTRYTYAPGATIEIEFEEFVDHPGYFRISFDDDGDDDFVDPSAIGDYYTNATVLLDDIPDAQGGSYTVAVTLPDIECERCTLQLAQIMSDKAPYGDGNDLYYNCVDISLAANGDPSDGSGGVAESESSGTLNGSDEGARGDNGCACFAGEGRDAPGGTGLLMLAFIAARGRRSSCEQA